MLGIHIVGLVEADMVAMADFHFGRLVVARCGVEALADYYYLGAVVTRSSICVVFY